MASSELILRPALAADIPALSQLGISSFVDKFGYLYRAEDLYPFLDETHSEAALAGELAKPGLVYCLAERAGRLVGYCKISLDCGWPEYARGERTMELKQLYTASDATGGGIGAALMDWAMAQFTARGADEVQISVWSENFGAHRFYMRWGFEKVADITFRVGSQLDEEYLFARML